MLIYQGLINRHEVPDCCGDGARVDHLQADATQPHVWICVHTHIHIHIVLIYTYTSTSHIHIF